ncbi:hypothetical protein E2C01_001566 [Portunus trituberculatus]|uniref:Uncharacterized protein n=1 Tax=Portunus trituberculatus TaxID=210409 RepID=A0A5B7CIA4_PORTR|nr:hypothetical protein [Portunus trituberculatus]
MMHTGDGNPSSGLPACPSPVSAKQFSRPRHPVPSGRTCAEGSPTNTDGLSVKDSVHATTGVAGWSLQTVRAPNVSYSVPLVTLEPARICDQRHPEELPGGGRRGGAGLGGLRVPGIPEGLVGLLIMTNWQSGRVASIGGL